MKRQWLAGGLSVLFVGTALAAVPVRLEIPAESFVDSKLHSWDPKSFPGTPEEFAAKARTEKKLASGDRRVAGYYEYQFQAPKSAFYVIESTPDMYSHEFLFDNSLRIFPTGITHPEQLHNPNSQPRRLGSYYFTEGMHKFRITRNVWPNTFAEISKITLTEGVSLLDSMNLQILNPFENEIMIGLNEKAELQLNYANATEAFKLVLVVKKGGVEVRRIAFEIPASAGPAKHKMEFSMEETGVYNVGCEINGKPVGGGTVKNFNLIVINNTPMKASTGEVAKTLVGEIDCVKTAPEYRQGDVRIVNAPFGSYIETEGNHAFSRKPEQSKRPSWMAWSFKVPEANVPYVFEFDYPDDTERSTMFVLRSATRSAYPLSINADCGGEFKLTKKMQTASFIGFPFDDDIRLLVACGADGMRGAVSKIRIFKVNGGVLPPMLPAQSGMREYQNFYEEEGSMISVYIAARYNQGATIEQVITATERYCSLSAYSGASTLCFSPSVYGGDMVPAWTNPVTGFSTPYVLDFPRLLLLTAQRYQLDVKFDFSYNRKTGLQNGKEIGNCLLDNQGNSGYWTFDNFQVNPIHPETRKWLLGSINEFAARYSGFQNFVGFRIRNMEWQNSGVNNFSDLRYGYDDYTVSSFEKDTGINVPTTNRDVRRFGERYSYLTGTKYGDWVNWRVKKVTELYADAQKTLKAVRPDLELSTTTIGGVKTREYGIDPVELGKLGVVTIPDFAIGRTKDVEGNREGFLASFDPERKSMLPVRGIGIGLPYLEGGRELAYFSQLGLTVKGEDKPYYGGASWAGGENLLNPWSISLATLDNNLFSTGGIGYTFADRPIREFMNEYRRLPMALFDTLYEDPVAVRSHQDYLYAVNMLPVPVKVKIEFDGKATRLATGAEFDLRNFELRPYQLLTFKISGKPGRITSEVPAGYRQSVENQVTILERAARQTPGLMPLNSRIQELWKASRFWHLNNQLERNMKLMASNGLVIPDLLDKGQLAIPANANRSAVEGQVVKAETVLPSWHDETVLRGKSIKFQPEVKVNGVFVMNAGIIGGDQFGVIEVYVNGGKVGRFDNMGGTAYALTAPLRERLPLPAGKFELEFRSADQEKDIAMLYFTLDSVRQLIPPELFLVSEPYTHDKESKYMDVVEPAETDTGFKAPMWIPGTGTRSDRSFVAGRGASTVGVTGCSVIHFHTEKAQKIEIGFGVDYFFKMWLNGRQLDTPSSGNGPAKQDEFLIVLDLQPGWNELRIKVGSGSVNNGFWMSVNDPGNLGFSPDKSKVRRLKAYEAPAYMKSDFSKMNKEELKALKPLADKAAQDIGRAWHDYVVDNATPELKKSWEDAGVAAARVFDVQLRLMKADPKYAPLAEKILAVRDQLKPDLAAYGAAFIVVMRWPGDSQMQELASKFNAAWKESNLAEQEEFRKEEELLAQCNRVAMDRHGEFWMGNMDVSNFRNEILRFWENQTRLNKELEKR